MSSLNDAPIEQGDRDEGPRYRAAVPLRLGVAALLLVVGYALGMGSGYLRWGSGSVATIPVAAATPTPQQRPTEQTILPASYTLPVAYGDLGPQLLAAGAIDRVKFEQVYANGSQPLTDDQLEALVEGSSDAIAITPHNAHFLLNFFWALGLANKNAILDEGLMVQNGRETIGSFASTGGWTLGAKPVTEVYSSVPILTLTAEQQARVEEVAGSVYRPCCSNPTSFPDCNHGMAMLGLLELMGSQGASVEEMFEAAKYVNAFWFPQQIAEMAIFLRAKEGLDFTQIDARRLVGGDLSSAPGFSIIHEQLQQEGLLEQVPSGGNNCGV